MVGYIVRRLIQALFVTLLVTLGIFLLLHVLPGGAARAILGPRANAAQIAQFTHDNGRDQALPLQYWAYLTHLIRGDFGFSYKLNQSVGSILAQDIP
ncbi:MAG: ABC transporter permease, partial [Actinomycetota bacterium]|nr:ABC transporter permease [Actinomycetota bacterium]